MAEHFVIEDSAFRLGLDEAVHQMKEEGKADIDKRAERVRGRAAQLAPRLTGKLADSITVTTGGNLDDPWADVGTSDPVGHYQEFGTSKMAPHPFLRPALAEETG